MVTSSVLDSRRNSRTGLFAPPGSPGGAGQNLDPCERRMRFGPIQPMPQARSLLRWLLFG